MSIREVIQLMNFFRSFNVSWLSSVDHTLCWLDEECFFCNLRSMFLRLRQERIKGPYLLKLNEFICSISKYEEVLDYTLMNNLLEIEQNIEHTFKLIFLYRKSSPFFSTSQIYCTNCLRGLDKYVLNVVLEECHRSKTLTLDELLRLSIETLKKKRSCCQDKMKLEYFEDKYVTVNLSCVSSIDIQDINNISGYQISYRSHIEMKYLVGEQTFFRFDGQVYTQKDDRIFKSCFGVHKYVKIVAFYITKTLSTIDVHNAENFIYDKAAQLKLHKRYLKFINPDRFEEQKKIIREKDIARNQHPKRKLEQIEVNRKRNITESRIASKKEADKKRNANPSRIQAKNDFDRKRNETPSRKAAKKFA